MEGESIDGAHAANGASRSATRNGAFFGNDPERSASRRSISGGAGTTPDKKYSAYAFFSRNWGAFDYDFGAGPRFARVSPAALIDANAAIDPGSGNSSRSTWALSRANIASNKAGSTI